MTFEEWWNEYDVPRRIKVCDIEKAYEAGFNSCQYIGFTDTYVEYLSHRGISRDES